MLTVAVRAGGGSPRMGHNIALANFLGQRLVERVIGWFFGMADELLVTARLSQALAFLKVKVVADLLREGGSQCGLHPALSATSYALVGVVACDIPFTSPSLLRAEADLLS